MTGKDAASGLYLSALLIVRSLFSASYGYNSKFRHSRPYFDASSMHICSLVTNVPHEA